MNNNNGAPLGTSVGTNYYGNSNDNNAGYSYGSAGAAYGAPAYGAPTTTTTAYGTPPYGGGTTVLPRYGGPGAYYGTYAPAAATSSSSAAAAPYGTTYGGNGTLVGGPVVSPTTTQPGTNGGGGGPVVSPTTPPPTGPVAPPTTRPVRPSPPPPPIVPPSNVPRRRQRPTWVSLINAMGAVAEVRWQSGGLSGTFRVPQSQAHVFMAPAPIDTLRVYALTSDGPPNDPVYDGPRQPAPGIPEPGPALNLLATGCGVFETMLDFYPGSVSGTNGSTPARNGSPNNGRPPVMPPPPPVRPPNGRPPVMPPPPPPQNGNGAHTMPTPNGSADAVRPARALLPAVVFFLSLSFFFVSFCVYSHSLFLQTAAQRRLFCPSARSLTSCCFFGVLPVGEAGGSSRRRVLWHVARDRHCRGVGAHVPRRLLRRQRRSSGRGRRGGALYRQRHPVLCARPLSAIDCVAVRQPGSAEKRKGRPRWFLRPLFFLNSRWDGATAAAVASTNRKKGIDRRDFFAARPKRRHQKRERENCIKRKTAGRANKMTRRSGCQGKGRTKKQGDCNAVLRKKNFGLFFLNIIFLLGGVSGSCLSRAAARRRPKRPTRDIERKREKKGKPAHARIGQSSPPRPPRKEKRKREREKEREPPYGVSMAPVEAGRRSCLPEARWGRGAPRATTGGASAPSPASPPAPFKMTQSTWIYPP
ncbi:putative DNA pol3 gamma3 superfamily incomplete domain [Pandoravirus japonicus]|uniref:DNA pol3 gamma3 superfamily incomplete domain n=1 Tax=Pandoravirus japonicus TaxID=2823154 RepID=A0A811BMH5_9VIRU|nr:putative DNA pol3 gamma3 superfamily incomplete domain [Pandoravirus japonicus]